MSTTQQPRGPELCGQLGAVVTYVRHLVGDSHELDTDADLLGAFVARCDQSAFAGILRRHGPMVLRVCRRVLGDRHFAEDAFQGVFLILAQQAASIRNRTSLASWLHGTAHRVASNYRRSVQRARHYEATVVQPQPGFDPAQLATWQETQAILDEEILLLPRIYREAFVRCALEHESSVEVARQLGVTEPTIRNRLLRARRRLQDRLNRRGISLATVTAALAVTAGEAVPSAPLVGSTSSAAAALTAGKTITSLAIPKSVITIVTEMSQTMVLNKLKACVCLLILGTAVCTLAFARPDPNASDLPSRRVSNEDRPPQPKEVNSPKSDLARLEGAWMGEYKGDVIYYVFTAGKCTTINATNRQAVTYQFKLDEKKSPKRLDLTAAGKTVEAIYELTGNSLRIAAAHPSVRFYPLVGLAERIVARPTEFVDKDNNVTMITLKRITSEPEVRKGLTRTTGSGEPFSTLRGFRFNDAINNSLLPTAPTRSDLEILEAQVKVKQARVNATLVRLRSAEDRNKIIASLPANQISRLEREAYKAEVDAALADLEVRKAELVEVTAKYRAAQRSNVSVPQGTSSPYGFRKSPSKKDDTPVHEVNSRSLQLPLNIDPTRLKNIKELQLYVSGDFGKSWALASGVAGNAKSIRYEAPKYGEYWFSLRIVQTDGIMVPSSINDLKPVVKVRFVPDSVGK